MEVHSNEPAAVEGDLVMPKQHTLVSCCCFDLNFMAVLLTFPTSVITSSLVLTIALAILGNWWVRGALLAYFLFLVFLDPGPHAGGRWLYNLCDLREPIRHSYILKLVAGYYRATLRRTAPLPPEDGPYIFACNPHGILGVAHGITFVSEATGFNTLFPGLTVKMLGASALFRIPFFAEWCLMNGCGCVDKKACLSLLRQGYSITIAPGGAQEALECAPGKLRILRERKGFCKLALETGAAIVPVLAFGENDLYNVKQFDADSCGRMVQERFKQCFGFTPPLFLGRWFAPLLPRRITLSTVVGSPIRPQKSGTPRSPEQNADKQPIKESAPPTTEEIDDLHLDYVRALDELFDKYKAEYGFEDVELEFRSYAPSPTRRDTLMGVFSP